LVHVLSSGVRRKAPEKNWKGGGAKKRSTAPWRRELLKNAGENKVQGKKKRKKVQKPQLFPGNERWVGEGGHRTRFRKTDREFGIGVPSSWVWEGKKKC